MIQPHLRCKPLSLKSLAVAVALSCPAASALAADPEIEALKESIRQLQEEIKSLKTAQATSAATPSQAPASTGGNPVLTRAKSLKIYGSLDSGLEYINRAGPNNASLSRIPGTTGSGPTRIGLDLEHAITDQLKGIGRAEMGVLLDSGSSGQGSRLFGRQAYVGLETPYGSFTVGRQYSMLFHGTLSSDLLGPNIFGLGSIDAYIPNARSDNSVVWLGKFQAFSLGASYSFGRDMANSVPQSGTCSGEVAGTSKCEMWSLMARYDAPQFGLAAAIDRQNGGPGAAASFFNGLSPIAMTNSSDTDTRMTLNGYSRMGAFKLGVGWLRRKLETERVSVEQDTFWAQGQYPLTPQFGLDGGWFHVRNSDMDTRANLFVLRGTYNFDEQLAAYTSIGRMHNKGDSAYGLSSGGAGAAPTPGTSQSGIMAGIRYRF